MLPVLLFSFPPSPFEAMLFVLEYVRIGKTILQDTWPRMSVYRYNYTIAEK